MLADVSNVSDLRNHLSRCASKIREKYARNSRKLAAFLENEREWLDGEPLSFSIESTVCTPRVAKGGRPQKCFEDSSTKSKKRKVAPLLDVNPAELMHAAHLSLHASGDRLKSRSVKDIAERPSSSLSNTSISTGLCANAREFTPEEALALFIDCRLTTGTYRELRERSRALGHNLLPPYYKLQTAKKACCLPVHGISVTETRAEIPLQDVLDLTCERLCAAERLRLEQAVMEGHREFTLLSKWGCDGSGGQSQYKQRFSESSMSDASVFMFSFVPLTLSVSQTREQTWQNPVPGSTRFCRPIKFMFMRETIEAIRSEVDLVKSASRQLTPTKVSVDGVEILVVHQMVLTMVDGKVANALTDTKSSHRCYICQTTPAQLKTLSQPPPDVSENYSFGLSTLHAWIRLFEFLLHLSYRITLKKRPTTSEEKSLVSQRKKQIQKQFRDDLGLTVDTPRQGSGNTSDGNMARKFFDAAEESARITGVDVDLIKQFRVVLQALSSKFELDADKYDQHASETKARLIGLYPWCDMTPTVHKILDHGAQVVRYHSVPIGLLTEESQEARHKEFRSFRLSNTRKNSRTNTNFDLLSMLLVSSDPLIASLRKLVKRAPRPLDPCVAALIKDTSGGGTTIDEDLDSVDSDPESSEDESLN